MAVNHATISHATIGHAQICIFCILTGFIRICIKNSKIQDLMATFKFQIFQISLFLSAAGRTFDKLYYHIIKPMSRIGAWCTRELSNCLERLNISNERNRYQIEAQRSSRANEGPSHYQQEAPQLEFVQSQRSTKAEEADMSSTGNEYVTHQELNDALNRYVTRQEFRQGIAELRAEFRRELNLILKKLGFDHPQGKTISIEEVEQNKKPYRLPPIEKKTMERNSRLNEEQLLLKQTGNHGRNLSNRRNFSGLSYHSSRLKNQKLTKLMPLSASSFKKRQSTDNSHFQRENYDSQTIYKLL